MDTARQVGYFFCAFPPTVTHSVSRLAPLRRGFSLGAVYRGTGMAFSSVATPEARAAARRLNIARADARALALAPVIAEIRASGITTPYAIAAALTRRGIPTARGHRVWTDSPVRKMLTRLDRLAAGEG